MKSIGWFVALVITGGILCTVTVDAAGVDKNYSEGKKLIAQGDYEAAARKLALAYKENRDNAEIALSFAMVAPGSLSVAIFTRCAGDTTVSDSLRAVAYGQLGDYSFVHSAFKTAAEKYRHASSLYSDPLYRHRWALASFALHDYTNARSLWQTITLEHGTDLARQAQYHLALIDMEEEAFVAAFAKLDKCGPPDSLRSWTVAATAAKLECALHMGKKKEAASIERQLQPYGNRLLERDLLTLAALHTGNKKKPASKKNASTSRSDSEGTYTLQVGAFGSLDNATRLQQKLEATFDAVTVVPVTLGDQVFYRVRVGSFASKERAESFGNDSLKAAGIAFKAVAK